MRMRNRENGTERPNRNCEVRVIRSIFISTPLAFIGAILLSACSQGGKAVSYTLYRNSPSDHASRIHFATFDVTENRADYNQRNCEMAARVLNANVVSAAE